MSKGLFNFGGKDKDLPIDADALKNLGSDLLSGPGKELVKSVLSDISSKNYAAVVPKLPALIPLLGSEGKRVKQLLGDYKAGKLSEKDIAQEVLVLLQKFKQ